MNNIQKAFKRKCGLRMATGGIIGDPSDLIKNPVASAPQRMAGFNSMDFDPQADLNSLSPSTSAPSNPFYSPTMGNDPRFSGSTDPNIQRANLRTLASAPIPRPTPATNTMTPVDELLPSRRGLRMADGGVVETPEQVMARMAAKYGVGTAAPEPVTSPVPPAPAPAPQPAQPSGGLFQGAVRTLRGRAAQIDKAAGMAEGGTVVADGGRSKAPTADSVPVNLSHGEAVLPVKTVAALGGPAAVETLIETTNGKPTATRGLRAGGRYAYGAVSDVIQDGVRTPAPPPELAKPNWINPQTQVAVRPTPAGTPPPTGVPAGQAVVPAPQPGVGAGAGASGTPPIDGQKMSNARYAFNKFAERANNLGKMSAEAMYEAAKQKLPAAIELTKRGGRALMQNFNTATNAVAAAGDVAAANSGRGYEEPIADAIFAIPRVMGGAIDESLGRKVFDPDMGAMRRGLTSIEAAGNVATGYLADRLPGKWVAKLGIGGADAATNFRPITSIVHKMRGDTPIEEMYREKYNTGYGAIPSPVETARNGVAAMSSDGKTTLMARKEAADAAEAKAAKAAPTVPATIEPGAQERTFQPPTAAPTQPQIAQGNLDALRAMGGGEPVRTLRGAGTQIIEGRDANGRKIFVGGHERSDAENEKLRQTEAERMKGVLAKQVDYFARSGIESDLKSNNEFYQRRGLARQKAFDENARTDAAREVAAANRDIQRQDLDIRREDLGLRRAQEARALAGAQFDREQKILETQRKATEDMDKDEKQAYDAYLPMFMGKGKDAQGNEIDIEDKAAHAAFINAVRHTMAQRNITNPVAGKPISFGSLPKTEQDRLHQRYKAVQRLKSTMGNFPWNASKVDSLNLDDFDAVQNPDGTLSFPALETRMKGRTIRARQKDFEWADGPSKWYDPFQTPDNSLLQNLLSKRG